MSNETYRKNVTALRKARGWSPSRLAREAGLSPSSIARIESGERRGTDWNTVSALAAVFGVDPRALTAKTIDPASVSTTPKMPVGRTSSGDLLQLYLTSEWLPRDKPTSDELAWLAGLGFLVWTGSPPTAETAHVLIEEHRAGRL